MRHWTRGKKRRGQKLRDRKLNEHVKVYDVVEKMKENGIIEIGM